MVKVGKEDGELFQIPEGTFGTPPPLAYHTDAELCFKSQKERLEQDLHGADSIAPL